MSIAVVQRRRKSSRKGASAVEFAVVAPVFFLIVFGMIEMSRVVMIQHSMTNASRAGCRRAVLATTTAKSQVDTTVNQYLAMALPDISSVAVDIYEDSVKTTDLSSTSSGAQMSVAVSVDYADVSWLPVSFLNINPKIGATSVQQRE